MQYLLQNIQVPLIVFFITCFLSSAFIICLLFYWRNK